MYYIFIILNFFKRLIRMSKSGQIVSGSIINPDHYLSVHIKNIQYVVASHGWGHVFCTDLPCHTSDHFRTLGVALNVSLGKVNSVVATEILDQELANAIAFELAAEAAAELANPGCVAAQRNRVAAQRNRAAAAAASAAESAAAESAAAERAAAERAAERDATKSCNSRDIIRLYNTIMGATNEHHTVIEDEDKLFSDELFERACARGREQEKKELRKAMNQAYEDECAAAKLSSAAYRTMQLPKKASMKKVTFCLEK